MAQQQAQLCLCGRTLGKHALHRGRLARQPCFRVCAVVQEPMQGCRVGDEFGVGEEAVQIAGGQLLRQGVQLGGRAGLQQGFAQDQQRGPSGRRFVLVGGAGGGAAVRIQHGRQRPMTGGRGKRQRRLAGVILGIGGHAQCQQAGDDVQRRGFRRAGKVQGIAARRVRCVRVGRGSKQVFQQRQTACACGFVQGGAARGIGGVHVRVGGKQCAGDFGMACGGGFVQGAAAGHVACGGAGLVSQQQVHAGRVVLFAAGGAEQCWTPCFRFRLAAPFQ